MLSCSLDVPCSEAHSLKYKVVHSTDETSDEHNGPDDQYLSDCYLLNFKALEGFSHKAYDNDKDAV